MKNNKIDSNILDDNYFPEEGNKVSELGNKIRSFFKVIGFTILNTTFYVFSVIFFFMTVYQILLAQDFMSKNLAIFSTLLLSYSPFIFLFYWQSKKEKLLDSNWQIWVSILTFLIIVFISVITYKLCYFRYA